jgi:hypothetical protein
MHGVLDRERHFRQRPYEIGFEDIRHVFSFLPPIVMLRILVPGTV